MDDGGSSARQGQAETVFQTIAVINRDSVSGRLEVHGRESNTLVPFSSIDGERAAVGVEENFQGGVAAAVKFINALISGS
jgi:hypothetical protein